MKMRVFFLFSLLFLFFYSCTNNSPQAQADYFPNADGSWWKYQCSDTLTLKLELSGVETIGGEEVQNLIWNYENDTNTDYIFGVLSLILVIFATWQIFGKTLPIVLFILSLYVALGSHLPEPFTTPDITWKRFLTYISSIGIDWGIWGDVVSISANYLFLFILLEPF